MNAKKQVILDKVLKEDKFRGNFDTIVQILRHNYPSHLGPDHAMISDEDERELERAYDEAYRRVGNYDINSLAHEMAEILGLPDVDLTLSW